MCLRVRISAPADSAGHHQCGLLWSVCCGFSVCVCEVRGLAPLLFSVKVFSNHMDRRGSCLLCVGVCPCEQPVGPYREIAGADTCHVLVYECVSE